MDRRKSIKSLLIGTVATSVLIDACKNDSDKRIETTETDKNIFLNKDERQPEEIDRLKKEMADKFFDAHEMATITILADIIIPRDDVSGSATDAKVPDFIEFIVKDMPDHQTPMRGGLRWLDVQCLNQFNNSFKDCTTAQQIEMIDAIAYPAKAKAGMQQGVAFFNLLRNLVATGFYTSEIGVKDVGYAGNTPTRWNGVPDDVLKQYNINYSDKELKECVSF